MSGAKLPPGLTPAPPTMARLEELVVCAERRLARARAKLEAAQHEMSEAEADLQRAVDRRTAWIADNPDPQLMML